MSLAVQRQVQSSPDVDRSSPKTETREAVSLDDAAHQTGLPLDALRKRLQRGQMDGYKANDGRWRVYVSDLDNALDNDRSRPVSPNNDRSRPANDAIKELLESVRERIADKSGVIDYLKGQIAEKDRQIVGKDKLIADLVAKLPAIDGRRITELERRNQSLEIQNKKNALILKRAYKILREDLKSEK
jgi:hypothetical protein